MTFLQSYRGQPLVALVAVIGGWVVFRTVVWNVSYLVPAPQVLSPPPPRWSKAVPPPRIGGGARAVRSTQRLVGSEPAIPVQVSPRTAHLPVSSDPSLPAAGGKVLADPPETIVGHNLVWMAALSQMPVPDGLVRYLASKQADQPFYPVGREPARIEKRWSADGWLLLRSGGSGLSAGGAIPATYGASQAGAVLRYRLAPESPHRPAAYLRASAALGQVREREVAAGLSLRPIPSLPLVTAAELRAADRREGVRVRPAISVVTELSPVAMPHGFRLEVYGQAGYVGGRASTAFIDGQLRADRRLTPVGAAELRAGAGIWGGAQKGASRLDVGPSASVSMPLGNTGGARLGVDWRLRVVGNAAPSSGPALTISAGF